ncbi:uncharacterized protein LOC130806949 [Amaranthus tricolor]|uniref:uncharacterized protein LOC130806949 n=1 Tax=Amaranthus tricolor TaxID=29722 RepID=UPI00258ECF11|nr:uncharacterized protein LOC130806949 [Amaranthus tricolor]
MENPKSASTSSLNNPKTAINSYKEDYSYDDDYEFFDSYEDGYSSVEIDPKWGKELDSEGEPVYTPEPDLFPDREYSSVDAVFSNTDCEEEDWLDKLGPFSIEDCKKIRTRMIYKDLNYTEAVEDLRRLDEIK